MTSTAIPLPKEPLQEATCKPGNSGGIKKTVHNRKYTDKGESRHGLGPTSYL